VKEAKLKCIDQHSFVIAQIAPHLGSDIVNRSTAASAMPGKPAVKNAIRHS